MKHQATNLDVCFIEWTYIYTHTHCVSIDYRQLWKTCELWRLLFTPTHGESSPTLAAADARWPAGGDAERQGATKRARHPPRCAARAPAPHPLLARVVFIFRILVYWSGHIFIRVLHIYFILNHCLMKRFFFQAAAAFFRCSTVVCFSSPPCFIYIFFSFCVPVGSCCVFPYLYICLKDNIFKLCISDLCL